MQLHQLDPRHPGKRRAAGQIWACGCDADRGTGEHGVAACDAWRDAARAPHRTVWCLRRDDRFSWLDGSLDERSRPRMRKRLPLCMPRALHHGAHSIARPPSVHRVRVLTHAGEAAHIDEHKQSSYHPATRKRFCPLRVPCATVRETLFAA